MSSAALLPAETNRTSFAPNTQSRARLAKFAWGVLAYTLGVILFGAVVRVTGSGAGCGQHWPTCHGEIAHLPQRLETAIEFSHRLSSALSLLAVIGLVVAVVRRLPRGHLARRTAWLALLFLVLEALIGAGLVLFALVADDTSSARAVVMPAHLTNTLLLMLCLTLTAWACTRESPQFALRGRSTWFLLGGFFALLVVSGTGAVTALGDTLYPVRPGALLAERVAEAGSAATLVERMRALHPLLALLAAFYLFVVAAYQKPACVGAAPLRFAVLSVLSLQVLLGVVNIWLSAPGWMQVLHLAVANALWVLWVLFAAQLLEMPSART